MSITIKIRNPDPQNGKPKWFTTSTIDNNKGDIIVYGKLGSKDAVDTEQIVNDAITGDKIKEGSIAAEHLYASEKEEDNSNRPVGTNSIQTKAITGAKIAENAITAFHINSGAVTTNELKGDSNDNNDSQRAVTTEKIRNNAITAAKLSSSETNDAVRAVTADAIQNNAIIAGKLFTIADSDPDLSTKKMLRPVVGDSIQDKTIPWSKMSQKLYQFEKTENLNYRKNGEETVPDYCFIFLSSDSDHLLEGQLAEKEENQEEEQVNN